MARRNALPITAFPDFASSKLNGQEQNLSQQQPFSHIGKLLVKASVNCLSETGPPERYKLVVIGDSESGKTCLLNALVYEDLEQELIIFDECVWDYRARGHQVEFVLWDLSGFDNYESLRHEMYRDTDVFLVCFDIGHSPSLDSVEEKWVPEIKEMSPNTPFLLIGCKNDLRTDNVLQSYLLTVPGQENDSDEEDSVSREKAEKVARVQGARDYVECCSKTRWNIEEVFRAAADAILFKDEPVRGDKSPSVLRRFSNFSRFRRGSAEQADIAAFQAQMKKSPSMGRRGTIF